MTSMTFISKSVSNSVSVRVPAGSKITPEDLSEKTLAKRQLTEVWEEDKVYGVSLQKVNT